MIKFSTEELDGSLLVRLYGDLNIESTKLLKEKLIPLVEIYNCIKLDFANVLFLDSSGMGLLLNIVQSMGEQKIKITITNVRKEIMEIFELLQIPEILGEGVVQ